MNTPLHRRICRAWLAVVVLLGWDGQARAQIFFNASTNVNVLREYDVNGTFLVSRVSTLTGPGAFNQIGANDGAGGKTQIDGFQATSVLSEMYTLPAARTVSSWQVQIANASLWNQSSLTLSGLVTGSWVMLDTYNPTVGVSITNRTFSAAKVTSLKYVATGPNPGAGGNFNNVDEVKVFLSPTVSQPLYGRVSDNAAFNILTDPGRIIAVHGSTNNNSLALAAIDLGNATYPVNGIVNGQTFVRAATDNPGSAGTDRAYVTYDFDQPYQMNLGHFGSYPGQPLGNWKFWTSNLADPDEDLDSDWVLQYTQVGAVIAADAPFSQPGQYQHLRFTWNVQPNAFVQLEVYGFIPEPSTALLLGIGGAVVYWRQKRATTVS